MKVKPFYIFPWQRPFLSDLRDHILKNCENPGQALLVTPNRRPWLYFRNLFAASGRACLLPKMLRFSDIVQMWRSNARGNARKNIEELDQAFLLHKCVCELANDDPVLAARFARMDMQTFLPWGQHLARLLERMFVNGVVIRDIPHLEDEVSPSAASLLAALGRIDEKFRQMLQENNWTTRGYDHFLARQSWTDIPHLLEPSASHPVFIAGFYILDGTQDMLFKTLWQNGAHICLQSDRAIVQGKGCDPACMEHLAWIRRWHARTELAVEPGEYADHKTQISFFSGYDYHSQLDRLPACLENNSDSTAIVLANPGLLMPVLHHLPDKDVNISMGYPLKRTTFANFIRELLELQLNRKKETAGEGRYLYYWRDLQKIFRQPYLKMLKLPQQEHDITMRLLLRCLDEKLPAGLAWADVDELADSLLNDPELPLNPDGRAFFGECIDVLIRRPARMRSIAELSSCLAAICEFFIKNGGDIWERFPLDAETLTHLRNNAIMALRGNEFIANEAFTIDILNSVVLEMLEQDRVPFEAFPLTGLQVMGLLETRMLSFRRVILLEATDDNLPGNPAQNPLLPDSLHALVGLPDSRTREKISAYNLYSLIAGADEVLFLWQEGVNHSAIFEGKKTRSRFVEQLVWQKEKEAGRVFETGKPPLQAAVANIHVKKRLMPEIANKNGINNALQSFFAQGISPGRLDDYLRCPLYFAWKNLLRLKMPPAVSEGEDPALIGDCIHKTLFELYRPYINSNVYRSRKLEEELQKCFKQQLEEMKLRERLPIYSWYMLNMSARARFADYLENQPDKTFIVALEKKLDAHLELGGKRYHFIGKIDRLDKRDDGLHLLDYKTGRTIKIYPQLLQEEFLSHLKAFLSGSAEMERDELFDLLCSLLPNLGNKPSLQMPFYLTILAAAGNDKLANASYVHLAKEGKELPLLVDMPEDNVKTALAGCRDIIEFVMDCIWNTDIFVGKENLSCSYCQYAAMCRLN